MPFHVVLHYPTSLSFWIVPIYYLTLSLVHKWCTCIGRGVKSVEGVWHLSCVTFAFVLSGGVKGSCGSPNVAISSCACYSLVVLPCWQLSIVHFVVVPPCIPKTIGSLRSNSRSRGQISLGQSTTAQMIGNQGAKPSKRLLGESELQRGALL